MNIQLQEIFIAVAASYVMASEAVHKFVHAYKSTRNHQYKAHNWIKRVKK